MAAMTWYRPTLARGDQAAGTKCCSTTSPGAARTCCSSPAPAASRRRAQSSRLPATTPGSMVILDPAREIGQQVAPLRERLAGPTGQPRKVFIVDPLGQTVAGCDVLELLRKHTRQELAIGAYGPRVPSPSCSASMRWTRSGTCRRWRKPATAAASSASA